MGTKKPNKLNLYSNLVNSRQSKKDASMRKRAKYLATLPKNPIKRFIYRLNPKHFFSWLFSKEGLKTVGKYFAIFSASMLVIGLMTFLYFRKDIDEIQPSEVSRRVHSTVNKYYDRNGKLLWDDKGDGDYKLVVDSENINDYMKKATIAIEDKDFYSHSGVSFSGILRALVNNLRGGTTTQGGSTLTQQLVKQVFFMDEAQKRGLDGIPRKIKEVILATEIERLYDKDQILTMYLNESPYGGRRNGVESGAQTYFGKTAKDLSLAESALLAAIPNQPYLYNPYYSDGNQYLIKRQHKVLDDMVEIKAITKAEADEAKKVAILDTIKPETDGLDNIKAPHFVLEAREQLEKKFGVKTVRAGGLSITTTLDLEAQNYAEAAVAAGAKLIPYTGADNIAMSSVDVETGQVIAMVGSVDFAKDVYGQRNASTSLLEPGSSIKPVVDFAPLFMQREGLNYGPGSILKDENIDSIYCSGNTSNCTLQNFTRGTYGNVTIRQSLGSSLNRPAVKAMYIVGPEKAVQVARDLGDVSYCQGTTPYLSSAIGGGCTLRQVEHTNTYASFARGGAYKPISYILEVKNSSGDQLMVWKDEKPKQAVDPQVAFMISDILADPQARSLTFGAQAYGFGFNIPGVWTASKTGTTENGRGQAKDSWMMSYSSKIATGVWSGNHDGAPMSSSDNSPVRRVMHDYMLNVHTQVYAKQGKWKSGDKVSQPDGIKRMTIMGKNDIWPSWFQQDNYKATKIDVDKVSKKKATECTPADARISANVYKIIDPVTQKETLYSVDGYDLNADDDVHKCSDVKPSVRNLKLTKTQDNTYLIEIDLNAGTHPLDTVNVSVDGASIFSGSAASGKVTLSHKFTKDEQPISVELLDKVFYKDSKTFDGPKLVSVSIFPRDRIKD